MQLAIESQISSNEFVANYWQQQPLLLKQALANPEQFISKETLLDLAQDPQVESRLVLGELENHQLLDGPFSTSELTAFKAQATQLATLLVQSVNLWHDKSQALLGSIDFLPAWRLDDIMISLSTTGAGVGAHVDQYDVLLVQLTGTKHWQIGTANAPVKAQVNALDNPNGLQLIEPFTPQLEVTVKPGDCLYVPANTAHYGKAIDNGMTLSIGFRSAGASELLMLLAEQVHEHQHYVKDAAIERANHFEITAKDTALATAALKQTLADTDACTLAYGALQTQPKQELILEPCDQPIDSLVGTLAVDPAARIAYQVYNQQIIVFCNGEYQIFDEYQLPAIQQFISLKQFSHQELQMFIDKNLTELLDFVIEVGYLGFK